MANNSTSLKSLARNLKKAAVKVPKCVLLCPKGSTVATSWCGRQGALPTDTKWDKIRYGVFDAVKRDRGDNRALLAAMAQLDCRK